jgi:hypothetical protein
LDFVGIVAGLDRQGQKKIAKKWRREKLALEMAEISLKFANDKNQAGKGDWRWHRRRLVPTPNKGWTEICRSSYP